MVLCSPSDVCVQALVLGLFPLHFFFQFLYYTDVASVAAVIELHLVRQHCRSYLHCCALQRCQFAKSECTCMAFCFSAAHAHTCQCVTLSQACLEQRYLLAALAAAAATGVRQTNAVWAAFALGVRHVMQC